MNSTPEPGEAAVADAPSSGDADATPDLADPALLNARDLALAALREVTPESTVGEPAGYRVEAEGVVSLRFENRLAGYPGWFWTVSLARLDDAEPTVLEVELLPGDGALLAPDWVPWAERLADYQAAQAALAELALVDEADELDDLEDVDDLDASDFDEDGSPILHAGDVDGVDIDELDEDAVDEDDELEEDAGDEDDELEADELEDAEEDLEDPADEDDLEDAEDDLEDAEDDADVSEDDHEV
jgi:hypothetical protein